MRLVGAVLLLLGLGSCGPQRASRAAGEWTILPNAHARFFEIARQGDAHRVITFGPGGWTDTLSVLYIGTNATTSTDDHLAASPTRMAVLGTPYLSYLAVLDGASRVTAASFLDKVMDTLALSQLPTDVAEVDAGGGVDRERLVTSNPQVVLEQAFGQGAGTSAGIMGVPTLYLTEYLEPHPLGRAEWIRVFGVLLTKGARADSLFQTIATRYEAVRALTGGWMDRPTVFLGSTWQGLWYLPPADSYIGQLIADAGGVHCMPGHRGTSNLTLDLETVMREGMKVTHFGALLATNGRVDALTLAGGDSRIASLPSLRLRGFMGNSATSDLFGKALVEPDIVLRDLQCILHPAHCRDRKPTYFVPLAQ